MKILQKAPICELQKKSTDTVFQMLANMKQQFVELLSDIGFVQEGISVRDVERAGRDGGDGVLAVTGSEVRFTVDTVLRIIKLD